MKGTQMTTSDDKLRLLSEYLPQLEPYKALAKSAFGARDTESEAHEASREYTRLLKEYTDRGGSLLKMADALQVTYPSLRRRVMTAEIAPLTRHKKSKATHTDYVTASAQLEVAKRLSTEAYHDTIYDLYKRGVSLNKLAAHIGLKSAYPLYYGLNKSRLRAGEGASK